MRLLTALRYLPRNLRSHKLRTLLCALGIAWGTLVMSLLMAFAHGLHQQFREDFATLGSNLIYGWVWTNSKPWEGLPINRRLELCEEDLEFLREDVRGLKEITPVYSTEQKAFAGDKNTDADIQGIEPLYLEMRDLPVLPGGRLLAAEDHSQRRRVAVIGPAIARKLFEGPAAGRILTLSGSEFVVIGSLRPKAGQDDDRTMDGDRIYIPASTFKALTGRDTFTEFLFRPEDTSVSESTVESLRSALARRLRFDPTDKDALEVWDVSETTRSVDSFMLVLMLFNAVAGLMTLVAGGVGVSNIMSVAVEERTHETGILMALGARRSWVLTQFLSESLVIAVSGGVLGLLAGWGLCWLLPELGMSTEMGAPTFSSTLALLVVLALGTVGVASGYGPAKDAASMDPITAMRM